jgi:NodT family efflux transporter outer membrane factor (OMF) lipoprotein
MKACVRLVVHVLLYAASVALAGGCMMGPKYSRPETPAETATSFVHAPQGAHAAGEVAELDRWWERFGDPVTADLVRQALEGNYDLKASAARVLQAREGLSEAKGRLWPEVSYGITRDRSKRYFNFGGGGGEGLDDPNNPLLSAFSGGFSPLTTTWSQDISVSYLVDFWGKLRRARRAAWEELLASEANRQALTNSTIALVIQARIDVAVAQRRLALAKADVKSLERTLEITERRHRQGLIGPVDVRLARASLEGAKAQEPAIASALAMSRHALDVLVGRRPGASPDLPQTLADLPELASAPVGVPGALLDRRPDVRAAEFALRAANERVGVSIAQLYPDLILSASYGRSADRWEDIWKDFSETYSAAFNLAQPIFRGGQLRAQVRAAKARYEEAAAVYGGVVLGAMRQVEDALIGEQLLQRQFEHAQVQLQESQAAEELSRRRYEQGAEGLLTVLESERRRHAAEEQVAILNGQLWTTRVNLHLALGGDWAGAPAEQSQVVKK